MAESSLFSRLKMYQATPERSQSENYLTEIFCWLLNESPEAEKRFWQLVGQKEHKAGIFVQVRQAKVRRWTTQVRRKMPNGTNVIADLVCFGESGVVLALIEIKVASFLHPHQMENYGKAFPGVPRILLVKERWQFSEPGQSEADILWNEVAEAVSDVAGLDLPTREFCRYLTEEGLGVIPKLSAANADAFSNCMALLRVLKQSFKNIKSLSNKETIQETFGGIPEEIQPKALFFRDDWGRFGLEWTHADEANKSTRHWIPAIFTGIMRDGEDHCLPGEIRNELLLYVCLDLQYDKSWHDALLQTPCWASFQEEFLVAMRVKGLTDRASLANAWHPVMAYLPVSTFMRKINPETGEVKADVLEEELTQWAIETVKTIVALPHFVEVQRFIEEFNRKA